MIYKRINIFVLIIFFAITCTGCWDNRSLTDIGILAAMGIDKKDDLYQVTYQIVKPGVIKSGSSNSGSSGENKAFWTYSSEGETIFDAIRNSLSTTDQKIYFNYIQIIVLGEELARDGIKEVLDFLERDPEFARTPYLLVVKEGLAKDIIEAESKQEDIPAMHITDIIENNKSFARIRDINFIEVLNRFNQEYNEVVTGKIEIVSQENEELFVKNLKVIGSAVFRKDILVGWLSGEETRGLLFVENAVANTVMVVPNPEDRNKKVSIEIKKSETSINIEFKEYKPSFLIEINAEGNLAGQQGPGNLTEGTLLKELEKFVEEKIKTEVQTVLDKARVELKSDFLDFSGTINKNDYRKWNNIKDNWEDLFPEVVINVEVSYKMRQSGLVRQRTLVR
ncbi:MAG: Ger(x)C family spore germination protein [Halanaerobiales bacterium]